MQRGAGLLPARAVDEQQGNALGRKCGRQAFVSWVAIKVEAVSESGRIFSSFALKSRRRQQIK